MCKFKERTGGQPISTTTEGKAFAVLANWLPAQNPNHTLQKHIGTMIAECYGQQTEKHGHYWRDIINQDFQIC